MTLYDLIVKTRPNGNKEITVKNDDIIDSLTLMLDQKGKQYQIVGSKTSNVYKFIFPSLDFGLVRLRFVSKMGTIKKASPIFEITIENDVISSPSETPAYISNLEDLDNKYKAITDTNISSITTLTTDLNTFKTEQNTKTTTLDTTLNSYITSNNAVVSTLSTNMMSKASNAYVDTSITNALTNYYTKLEVDNKYIPYVSFVDNYYKISGIDTNKLKTTILTTQTIDLSNATSVDKAVFTPLSDNGQFLLPFVENKFGTQNYTTKTQIENRYLIHYNNDKGGVDTNQEAGFYYGFNTVDTPINNGYQIAGLGLYTYTTTNAGDHGLAFYTYYRQDKTVNYSRTKKTIVTSGNTTIDGATWNFTSSLQFSGTGAIYMTPEADVFIQPGNSKTITLGSFSGTTLVNNGLKVRTIVGTQANYDTYYNGRLVTISEDDGSLLLNIGTTDVTPTDTTYNSIRNIQIKTDVMGKTYIRKFSKANNVTGFSNWEKIITSADPTYGALDTRYDIATKTGLYGDHFNGLRASMNINNWEMWFSTHSMSFDAVSFNTVKHPDDTNRTLTGCRTLRVPVPTGWIFDKLIDIRVDCFELKLDASIDPAFYTNELLPRFSGANPAPLTYINILLTAMLSVRDVYGEWYADVFEAYKSQRTVPKIKITGIGKVGTNLANSYNGFTSI